MPPSLTGSSQLNKSAKSNLRNHSNLVGSSAKNKKINPILKNEKSLLEKKKRIVEKRLEAFSINHGDQNQEKKNKSFSR